MSQRLLFATLVAIVSSGVPTPAQAPTDVVTVFSNARLIQLGASPAISDTAILVRNGRVAAVGPVASIAVPAGARQVDLGGRFVLPGLISTHVHISDVAGPEARAYTDENTKRQLGVFARYGITSLLSLGGEQAPAFAARQAQSSSIPLDRSRIFLSGDIVTAATPDAAREQVARVAALKPDMIKIRVDDNLGTSRKMLPEVFQAVIDETHKRGLRVSAHVFYLDDAKALLRAGVDMIAHSVRDKDIDAEFIALMRAANVPYCPTLTRELSTFVYESTPAFFEEPFFLAEADPEMVTRLKEPARQRVMEQSKSAQAYKAALVVAERNVKAAADAGLLVVMGTDSGPFPERFQGYFEHVEMAMMVAAGLTPAQVLRSATSDAARALRVTDVGAITPGAWADFVVLDRNPLEDIRNTRAIASVWIAGHRVPAVPSTRLSVDSFVWSPARVIDWSDFRGAPNMASKAAAMTAYSITSEARCDEGRFTFRVESYFLPTRSWVKSAHLLERASDRTLQHERTHFDLSEVQARRARAGLGALASPCELPDAARDRLVAPYLAGDATVQAQYDRETINGTHGPRQAEWDQRVRNWLRELPR